MLLIVFTFIFCQRPRVICKYNDILIFQKETEVSIKTLREQYGDGPPSTSRDAQNNVNSSTTPASNTSNPAFWTASGQLLEDTENMDVDADSSGPSNDPENPVQPMLVKDSSTQTSQPQPREMNNITLQNYAKLIKPILSASSRLGRALAELFGLLVKVRLVSLFLITIV